MVQVGAAVDYDDPMDEQPQPSWTIAVRSAVKELVEAVNESSKMLASATERFAVESLQAIDAASTRSESSAEASAEMARRAEQAAADARSASAGLQSAIEEAREHVRDEARLAVEQVASQKVQIDELGAQVKDGLQQRIDEMVARLEAGSAGHLEAMERARQATTASHAAAERIAEAVSAVEAAVDSARHAAQDARTAAEDAEKTVGSANQTLLSAQEAAESSRQSAALAEQAGSRNDFAVEAGMLLERLETDYSLLTRLVQELHVRISNLSVAPPPPAYGLPADDEHNLLEAGPDPQLALDTVSEVNSVDYEPPAPDLEATATASLPALESAAWPQDAWLSQPPEDLEVSGIGPDVLSENPPRQPSQPVIPELSESVMPQASFPAQASITIFGRVQITISPVADFDRLLNLDSALSRIAGVKSVTLADYAHEQVVFRVDLDKPVTAVAFAAQLSETGGVPTEVTEASETTLSVRLA